jgi:hypothetical protein
LLYLSLWQSLLRTCISYIILSSPFHLRRKHSPENKARRPTSSRKGIFLSMSLQRRIPTPLRNCCIFSPDFFHSRPWWRAWWPETSWSWTKTWRGTNARPLLRTCCASCATFTWLTHASAPGGGVERRGEAFGCASCASGFCCSHAGYCQDIHYTHNMDHVLIDSRRSRQRLLRGTR